METSIVSAVCIGRNCLVGNGKKIAKFLMRTFTCRSTFLDGGDRCLFTFLSSRCVFLNIFPFPVFKAQLIGDWYENRRGSPNTIIFLIIRQY
jgi:hypothetical protein